MFKKKKKLGAGNGDDAQFSGFHPKEHKRRDMELKATANRWPGPVGMKAWNRGPQTPLCSAVSL